MPNRSLYGRIHGESALQLTASFEPKHLILFQLNGFRGAKRVDRSLHGCIYGESALQLTAPFEGHRALGSGHILE